MPKLLDVNEMKLLFSQFDIKTEIGLRNWLIVRLALDLGLREKSIATLKLMIKDLEQGYIQGLLKGNKYHPYPIDKTLKAKLREYLTVYRRNKETDSEYLFLNNNGAEVTTNTIKQLFKRLSRIAI